MLSPGPVLAGRGRHLRRGDPALRRQAADPRRVPGPPGIGAAFGGKIVRAQQLMHGKTSVITHHGRGRVRAACRERFTVDPLPLAGDRARHRCPAELDVTAWTRRRRDHGRAPPRDSPIEGVQFHPESILTEHGHAHAEELPGGSAHETDRRLAQRHRHPADAGHARGDGRGAGGRRRLRRRPDA